MYCMSEDHLLSYTSIKQMSFFFPAVSFYSQYKLWSPLWEKQIQLLNCVLFF